MAIIPNALNSDAGQAILKRLWILSFAFSVMFHIFTVLQSTHHLAFRELALPSLMSISVFLALVLDQFFVQVTLRPSALKKNLAIVVCLYPLAIGLIGFCFDGLGEPAMLDGAPSLVFKRGRQVFQIPLEEYQRRRNMELLFMSSLCLGLSSLPLIRRLPGNTTKVEDL